MHFGFWSQWQFCHKFLSSTIFTASLMNVECLSEHHDTMPACYSMRCWTEVHLYGPLVPARLTDLTGGKSDLSLICKLICLPPLCAAPDWDYLECLQFKLISWAELPFRFLSVIDNLCASFQVLLSEGNFGESNLVKNFYLESKSWSSNSPKLHYIKGVRHSSMVVSKVEKPFWNRKTEGFWDS